MQEQLAGLFKEEPEAAEDVRGRYKIGWEFVTSSVSGASIFTITDETLGKRFTYSVKRKELRASGQYPARTAYFLGELTGPDNNSDYSYVGELDIGAKKLRFTRKSFMSDTAPGVVVFRKYLDAVLAGHDPEARGLLVHHCGKCGRCGRRLTVPESIEMGLGPECAGKV